MWNFFKNLFFPQQKTLICMRQENTWVWGSNLGKKTPGVCDECGAPIFFEEQNKIYSKKMCHVCAGM